LCKKSGRQATILPLIDLTTILNQLLNWQSLIQDEIAKFLPYKYRYTAEIDNTNRFISIVFKFLNLSLFLPQKYTFLLFVNHIIIVFFYYIHTCIYFSKHDILCLGRRFSSCNLNKNKLNIRIYQT
jgi:hypothetical protein